MTLFLEFMCVVVGFLCGATSIGGILLIPAIQYSAGMDLPMAAGTATCSFFFTAAWGTWLHWRNGNLRRDYVLPQCIGALLFGCIGALAKAAVGSAALNAVLSVIIVVSGIAAFRPPRPLSSMRTEGGRFRYLLFVGALVGFLAGLTGMGGPVLSVPMMIIMGFSPLLTVAAAQPFQTAACLSGIAGNMAIGQIDWTVAMSSVLLQAAGIWLGVCFARRMGTGALKRAIAALCIMTGVMMMARGAGLF